MTDALALLDRLLAPPAFPARGAVPQGYSLHARRVFLFAQALTGATGEAAQRLAVAAAFHDLAIWPSRELDYLTPSADLAEAWLRAEGLDGWVPEVRAIIKQHHKLTPWPGGGLVEAFRQADLIDLSLGLIRFGLPQDQVRAIRARHPNAGFHRCLLGLVAHRVWQNPWRNPMPMLRW